MHDTYFCFPLLKSDKAFLKYYKFQCTLVENFDGQEMA